jgi:hypothetical protein
VSSVRYYVDEHVGNTVVQGLRQRGVDILTVAEAGMLSATDEAQLGFAASGISDAGVVYTPRCTSIGPIVRGLLLIHNVLSAEDLVDRIEYI